MNLLKSLNRKFKNLSFRRKFVFSFIIPIFFASLFIYLYIPARIETQAHAFIADKTEGISNMTSYAISSALFYEDKETIKESFNIIKQDKEILYAVVTDLSNELIFYYNQKLAEENWYKNDLNNQEATNTSVFKYKKVIIYNNNKVGILYLGVSLTNINKQITEVRTSIATISIICFIIALIIVYGIGDYLSKPLEKIEETIGKISDGEISKRLEYNYNDEIGHFAKSFNQMLDELENTLTELKQINAEKDKFFSIIAHDLKSPFAGFLGLTQIMSEQMQNLSLNEIQDYSKSLKESAANLYKLLENLLEWSRMKRGLISFSPDNIILSQLVNQNIEIIAESAKQKEITITSSIPEGTMAIADSQMLNTVIRNLISNAIKFTNHNGEILISSENIDNDMIKISVKDNGIGMDAVILGNLFRVDVKVSQRGTDNEPSTGIGLLLCKEFVYKNGGEIWVESTEGKGSTFHFTVPVLKN
ncbi:MAG: HAMP domain-containing histidine kinase [Ignavibacteriae bacterium]|nr:HAMP domain-containing histidine kinase [Ignavibacteriota bacterium]